MKILLNVLIIALGAAAGLGFGYAWRGKGMHSVSPQVTTTAATHSASSASKFSGRKRVSTEPASDSPLATKLARDLSMSSSVTRWLLWMEALEKATPPDFPSLARLASGNSIAMRLVAAKWAEANPRQMFDHIVSLSKGGDSAAMRELASVLMDEWPKRDLEGAIAALNSTNSFTLRGWRDQLASKVVDQDPERGLKLFSQWSIQNYAPNMKSVAKWAAENPQHAAEVALANPAGYASQVAMETIAKEWAKTDPATALSFAAAQRGELSSILAKTTLKEWASRDLENAAKWLGATAPATRERMSAPFVEAWAKSDANAALAWCEENLSGSSQSQAVAGVFKGMAAKNASGAADLVLTMNPSASRAAAAVAVAEKWFPSFSSDKPVAQETLAWLEKLDGESARKVIERMQWSWAENDPKSMAAFLAKLNSEQIPANSYSSLARSMARKNPLEAIEWTSQLPAQQRLTAATDAFTEWQRSQPEAAQKWVMDLPASDSRRETLFQTAISMLAHFPDATDQLALLSANDRVAAQKIIQNMPSLQDERRAKLLQALK
jgi:hypothetical protein